MAQFLNLQELHISMNISLGYVDLSYSTQTSPPTLGPWDDAEMMEGHLFPIMAGVTINTSGKCSLKLFKISIIQRIRGQISYWCVQKYYKCQAFIIHHPKPTLTTHICYTSSHILAALHRLVVVGAVGSGFLCVAELCKWQTWVNGRTTKETEKRDSGGNASCGQG